MAYRSVRSDVELLTVCGRVLVAIAADPLALLRDLADATGITERTVQAAVAELEAAGYITRERTGRRNRYTVHADAPLRHAGPGIDRIGPVLDLLARHPSIAPSEPEG